MPDEYDDENEMDLETVIIRCIQVCFFSRVEKDAEGEALNVVDGLFAIARALNRIADTQDRELEHVKSQRSKP